MTRKHSGLWMGRGGFIACRFTVFGKCIKTASAFGTGQRGRDEWPFSCSPLFVGGRVLF